MIRETVKLRTNSKIQMLDITSDIRTFVKKNNIESGAVKIFIPHTTAGVTINENCDPDVQSDLNKAMLKLFPDSLNINHNEGNSAAHLMSSLLGISLTVFVENGKLLLGTWQGIYFWEFDGPRQREFYLIS